MDPLFFSHVAPWLPPTDLASFAQVTQPFFKELRMDDHSDSSALGAVG